jgi:hypothetical protein
MPERNASKLPAIRFPFVTRFAYDALSREFVGTELAA